ncbi:hypothetical protein ACFIJ5_17895 (plasmid) [Haloimpatiens sp. FM7330]|uniref:hypothetical protein n=1 Tax=Haloimpatiens sp. FM7330 TaxID=3298610 RepID=UPI0036402B4A
MKKKKIFLSLFAASALVLCNVSPTFAIEKYEKYETKISEHEHNDDLRHANNFKFEKHKVLSGKANFSNDKDYFKFEYQRDALLKVRLVARDLNDDVENTGYYFKIKDETNGSTILDELVIAGETDNTEDQRIACNVGVLEDLDLETEVGHNYSIEVRPYEYKNKYKITNSEYTIYMYKDKVFENHYNVKGGEKEYNDTPQESNYLHLLRSRDGRQHTSCSGIINNRCDIADRDYFEFPNYDYEGKYIFHFWSVPLCAKHLNTKFRYRIYERTMGRDYKRTIKSGTYVLKERRDNNESDELSVEFNAKPDKDYIIQIYSSRSGKDNMDNISNQYGFSLFQPLHQ